MRAAILILAALLAALSAGCAPLWDYSPRTPLEEEADYHRTLMGYKQLALARVKELNYQPNWVARSLAARRTFIVGLIRPLLDHPFVTWWIGTSFMVPFTLIAAFAILFRTRKLWLGLTFLVVATLGWVVTYASHGGACADGGPSCVQAPKCGNLNEMLDKHGALTLLRRLTAGAVDLAPARSS